MTDVQRQKLILQLRTTSSDPRLLVKAADEIERLAEENKELHRLIQVQEDAELWKRRTRNTP